MKKQTTIFVMLAAAIIMTLSSCQQTCYMTQPNGTITTYQATTCAPQTNGYNGYNGGNGYTGGNGNGGNGTGGTGWTPVTAPTNPYAGRTTGLFLPSASFLAQYGISGQTQFVEVIKDFDQNGFPDANAYGGVDNSGVKVPGYLSYDGGATGFPSVMVCNAGDLISMNTSRAGGYSTVTQVYVSNVPYAYDVSNPTAFTVSSPLSGFTNSGIYVKSM